ncbi:MAG: SDR family NAD(P)-dependent oxidoreductase [Dokdonella sp.]
MLSRYLAISLSQWRYSIAMSYDDETPPVANLGGPASTLVTGASSGIGLAIVRRLLENRYVHCVFALSRSATCNQALQSLRATFAEKLRLIDVDITSESDLQRVTAATQSVDALHLVVNAAGVLHGPGIAPEKSIEQVSAANFERVFALNAFAPLLLAKALLPKLCRKQPAIFASLSARVGSIGDNRAGGWYAYRASKAAQNQLLKTFSIEWKRRNPHGICLLLHPGTVDTPLSTPFQANVPPHKLFDTRMAADQLLGIIASSTPADSGHFIAWDGTEVPW